MGEGWEWSDRKDIGGQIKYGLVGNSRDEGFYSKCVGKVSEM